MTMNYWAAIIAVLCVILVHVHVLYGIDTNAESAAQEGFLIGPDGVTFCLLDVNRKFAGTASFMHQDKNGECACSLCRKGQHLRAFCECEEGSSLLKIPTDCGPVEIGQFMNQSNFCATPFNCTPSCPENQKLKENCSLFADIQCQCKEGWFNPNRKDTGSIPQECRQKPSCLNAGEEPLANDGTDGEDTRTFSCQTCRDGYFKEEGDGECKPHRICQRKAGNEFEDNQCLLDTPIISPPTQDPGTEGDECSCLGAWSFSIISWIAGFVVCLVFGIWNYLHYRKQKKLKEQKDRQAQVARNAPVINPEEETVH